LTTITTETYTRNYLANTCHQNIFYDIAPSLLINVGLSHIPAVAAQQIDTHFINFLTIRLNDEPNCVLNEVRRFIDQYETYITEPDYFRPKRGKSLFHYHGFYKQLFDFLARHHANGEDNSILIDISAHRIWLRGIEVQMSATLLATYIFILHQSFCTHYGGLIKAGQHHPLSDKEMTRLGHAYHSICHLFRDIPMHLQRSYLEDVPNIRGYIARIRSIIEHHIAAEDINYYYPKDSSDKSMYHIAIDPRNVRIRHAKDEYLFTDYPLWKQLR
jgi:hypothetical protein